MSDDGSFRSLQTMVQSFPEQMQHSSVQKAYAILLQLCCSPCCDLPSFMADGCCVPPPLSHNLSSFMHASAHNMPSGHLIDLPALLELDCVLGPIAHSSPSPGVGCMYAVSWCPTLTCTTTCRNKLARLGIKPAAVRASHNLQTLSVHWSESTLHSSVLQALWPVQVACL